MRSAMLGCGRLRALSGRRRAEYHAGRNVVPGAGFSRAFAGRIDEPGRMGGGVIAMKKILVPALFLMLACASGQAAVLDGVTMPDQVKVDGTELRLNGVGLRTYSMLRLPIYVAALYLEQPSEDGQEVIRSPGKKRLNIRFLRDVDAEKGKEAWRSGFADNCKSPCHLNPADVDRFLEEGTAGPARRYRKPHLHPGPGLVRFRRPSARHGCGPGIRLRDPRDLHRTRPGDRAAEERIAGQDRGVASARLFSERPGSRPLAAKCKRGTAWTRTLCRSSRPITFR